MTYHGGNVPAPPDNGGSDPPPDDGAKDFTRLIPAAQLPAALVPSYSRSHSANRSLREWIKRNGVLILDVTSTKDACLNLPNHCRLIELEEHESPLV